MLRIMHRDEVTNHDGQILVLDESRYNDTVNETRDGQDSNIKISLKYSHRENL